MIRVSSPPRPAIVRAGWGARRDSNLVRQPVDIAERFFKRSREDPFSEDAVRLSENISLRRKQAVSPLIRGLLPPTERPLA